MKQMALSVGENSAVSGKARVGVGPFNQAETIANEINANITSRHPGSLALPCEKLELWVIKIIRKIIVP